MKIVIASDIHIGDYSYGKPDPATGLGTRLLDFIGNLNQVIDHAIKTRADLFIIPGDIYRVKNPSSKVRKCFVDSMSKLLEHGIPTIIMTGNHDMAISQGNSHALSELEGVDDFIGGFKVSSSPEIIRIDDTEIYLLPFVNRGHHDLETADDLNRFHIEKIREFNELSKKSDAKYKIFFGHFGTDRSMAGGSFDLDMSDNALELIVRLEMFEEGNWTKVYLGHIHKQQEFNTIVRHVGSLSRVDFAEEDEAKGFYCYEDGADEFIPVKDRSFKTLDIDLRRDHREKYAEFGAKVKKMDLGESIVRVRINMRRTHVPEIRLEPLKEYMHNHCWHFAGVKVDLVEEEQDETSEETKITNVDSPNDALRKFVDKNPGRFDGIKDRAIENGDKILANLKKR